MVAKSYQKYLFKGEPFTKNGKMYIEIIKTDGSTKTVRWYTAKEYARMYPEDKLNEVTPVDPIDYKKLLGFEKGYITIFTSGEDINDEWFNHSNARFNRLWGWYVVSTEKVPDDLPEGVHPIRLDWDKISYEDNSMLPEAQIVQYCNLLRYGESNSEFQGQIGDRIERELTVEKAIILDGAYGTSTLHTMKDQFGNVYTWLTASKSWPVGAKKLIRGTVKDHKVYLGVNQTQLSRCTEVKK